MRWQHVDFDEWEWGMWICGGFCFILIEEIFEVGLLLLCGFDFFCLRGNGGGRGREGGGLCEIL